MPLVKDLVAEFLDHHRQHNSPATVKIYKEGLVWLLRRFGECEWEDEKHHFTRVAIRRALEESWHRPDGSPMSGATHRRNKSAFQQLQNYVCDLQELSSRKPLTKTDLKKPNAGQREAIPSDSQLDQVIAAASPAFALVLRGFRASAMRPNELCRADVEHLVTTEEETTGGERATVQAIVLTQHKTAKKTGKPRKIVLGPVLAAVVFEALRLSVDPPSSILNPRATGPIWLDERGARWSTRLIRDRWRVLRRRFGLAEDLVPYSLRHQAITKVCRNKTIWHASQLAGHSSINMTQRYAHGNLTDQLKAQAAIEGPHQEDDRKAA